MKEEDLKGHFCELSDELTKFDLYIDIVLIIGLMSRVFANGPGDQGSIPGRVIPKSQKMVLQESRVKWSNPE